MRTNTNVGGLFIMHLIILGVAFLYFSGSLFLAIEGIKRDEPAASPDAFFIWSGILLGALALVLSIMIQ